MNGPMIVKCLFRADATVPAWVNFAYAGLWLLIAYWNYDRRWGWFGFAVFAMLVQLKFAGTRR